MFWVVSCPIGFAGRCPGTCVEAIWETPNWPLQHTCPDQNSLCEALWWSGERMYSIHYDDWLKLLKNSYWEKQCHDTQLTHHKCCQDSWPHWYLVIICVFLSHLQLIDLSSPLIKWSPEDKDHALNEAPLINLSFWLIIEHSSISSTCILIPIAFLLTLVPVPHTNDIYNEN